MSHELCIWTQEKASNPFFLLLSFYLEAETDGMVVGDGSGSTSAGKVAPAVREDATEATPTHRVATSCPGMACRGATAHSSGTAGAEETTAAVHQRLQAQGNLGNA
jgi:hypothetical protein